MKQRIQKHFIQQLIAAKTPTEIINIREEVVAAQRQVQLDALREVRKLLDSLIPTPERVDAIMNDIYDEVPNIT